jgi:PAS domain-containing protein
MKSFAISPDSEGDYGRLILLFFSSPDKGKDSFTRSLVSAMGTSIVFVERLWEEHRGKEDYITLINQFPLGIAVFNKDAQCISANLILHRFLGAAPGFDFIRDYRFTEDDVLNAQGLVTTIKKAFDGFITEFIINYDPNSVKRFGFMGKPRDLRVKSVPLYGPGGRITNIALIYEDITVTDEPESGEDSKLL